MSSKSVLHIYFFLILYIYICIIKGQERGLESGLADKWFEAQKNVFVTAGKIAGDKRAIDRRGKLLRR